MYRLTLTRSERKAIDWIGNRYAHGDTLCNLLMENCEVIDSEDDYWEGPDDITYAVPEHIAWQISEVIDMDNLACFGPDLIDKLLEFQAKIV